MANNLWGCLIAAAPPAGPASPLGWLGPLFPFAMIAVLFYFMLVRPERRKRADMMRMLEQLKKNDRVVTIGGIHGVIVSVGKDEVTLRVDENNQTRLRFSRSAIARLVTADDNGSDETKK